MSRKFVVFDLERGQFAVPVEVVSQILRYGELTAVPAASSFVTGVINLGGEVVPVVNLRSRLSLPAAEPSRKNRVIVVTFEGRRCGVLVDGVREVVDLDEDSIVSEAATVFGMKAQFVLGIVKKRENLMVILDIARVLSAPAGEPIKEQGAHVDRGVG